MVKKTVLGLCLTVCFSASLVANDRNFVAAFGYSNMQGFTNYWTWLASGTTNMASGNTNGDVMARLFVNSSGVFRGTNFGVQGTLTSVIALSLINYGLATYGDDPAREPAHFVLISAGGNDLIGGSTFAAQQNNFNLMRTTHLARGQFGIYETVWDVAVVVSEPARLAWNAALIEWTQTNGGGTTVLTNDPLFFGGTTNSFDGTHPDLLGVDYHSFFVLTNLLTLESNWALPHLTHQMRGSITFRGNISMLFP